METLGKVINTHSFKGNVKVYLYTDDLDVDKVYIDDVEYNFKVISVVKNIAIIKFNNINDIEDTKKIMNKYIKYEKKKLNNDTYYISDLIDLDVYEDDKCIGKITDVLSYPANDVYVVNNDIYIPAIASVILDIDLNNKIMKVKMMEGLV